MSQAYHVEDEVQRRAYDAGLMRRLLGYVREHRAWMILAIVLLLLASLLSNVVPLLLMWSVDLYINNPDRLAVQAEAGPAAAAQLNTLIEGDLHGLLAMIGLISALILAEAAIRYLQLLLVAYVGQKTMFEMRVGLFQHLQTLSLSFLDRHPVGRLMTRVTNDVEKIQQTIVTGVVQVASDLMTIFVVLGFMFAINWRLACIAVSPVPFILLVSVIFRKYAHHSFLEIRKKIARVSAYLQENVSGMRIVQIFGREDTNYEHYRSLNASHRDEWLRQIRHFAIYFPAVDFLATLSLALIIFYCGSQILHLGHAVSGVASVGTFYGYVSWSEKLFGPIRAIADRYNLLLEAMASSERVFQLLDTPPEIQNAPDALPCNHLDGAVAFQDVWFSYGADTDPAPPPPWVLKGIDLTIAPGERVAIVGHTGAGKTTLTNLLSRFYDVQQGAVLVDGIDVRRYDQVALRRKIGVVLQEVFLFSGTVEENIRLGNQEMSPDRVRDCAAYVNAATFIDRVPGRYQYHVGERGCNLSTGQRQLLAFARTLAHDPQILVLDEATSSVDTETEALIQDAIGKLMAGRTSIVIAHRLSTVQHADRIVVMHHGEIRESGTHQELLAHGGLYRTLYELQYKDQDHR